jgi:hypothetical protein
MRRAVAGALRVALQRAAASSTRGTRAGPIAFRGFEAVARKCGCFWCGARARQATLDLALELLLADDGRQAVGMRPGIGRLANAIVAVLGPEYSPGSRHYMRCRSIIREMQVRLAAKLPAAVLCAVLCWRMRVNRNVQSGLGQAVRRHDLPSPCFASWPKKLLRTISGGECQHV